MKRVKQAESREAGMPNALASAKSQSRSKSSRTLPHNPPAGGANRLEQQRSERLLTGAGSRVSPSGRERSDSESSPSSSGSAIGGGATRVSPREGSGGGGVGILPPAADYGEQRSAQQLAWWRGTAPPRERSASAAPKPKRSGGAEPPPRRG
jgi:hypothetical protein